MANKPGTTHAGSLVWHTARLKPGGKLLIPWEGAHPQGYAEQAIRRALKTGALTGEYVVRVCVGHTFDLESLPFKFLSLERVR